MRMSVPPLDTAKDGWFTLDLSKYITAAYEPKEDITAYELALILPYVMTGKRMTEDDWKAMGTATRHLRRYDFT
jgi:hypothetical protein